MTSSVTVTRTVAAPPEAVRAAVADRESFVRAAGFDEVAVEGDEIRVANRVGPAEIALTLGVVDDPDAALAYEQREGIFESMRTTYAVEPVASGTESEVTAATTFALDVAFVGDVLDATVIRRQRRRELRAQLDYLERTAGE